MTSRAEHLEYSKRRAYAYLNTGDVQGAFKSMAADLDSHDETQGHDAISLGFMLMLLMGKLSTVAEMRDFIEGFN